MKATHAALAVAAACTALSLAPVHAGARGFGHGARGGHVGLFGYAPHFQFRTPPQIRFRATRPRGRSHRWMQPWYGGVVVLPQSAPAAATHTQPVAPLPIRSCRYLKQTVNVPAEAGGIAQITITRC